MLNKNIVEAELEARRFLKRIAEYKEAQARDGIRKADNTYLPSRYCSAIRRSSMDLTRALAKMRNANP